jgi:Calcineurin-like phosphoesterase
VVYYYGEEQYYYEQFYKPYKNYPAPIFAIPGNHDGITYNEEMVSLDAFQKAFCDDQPRHWQAAGGISRTTMIQPGVYFTLDAPFVSIIGLYSNCSESFGYLDQQQKLFLYNEMKRLKGLRESGKIAAILIAVHHPPLSFNPEKPSSARMRADMDTACQTANCWPDAVLSGHAHIYQRMTRVVSVDSNDWQIPYVVGGSGGNFNSSQEIDKAGVKLLDQQDSQFKLHHFLPNYGYLRITIKPKTGAANPTMRLEFHSPDVNAGHPSADACVLDLKTHQYII